MAEQTLREGQRIAIPVLTKHVKTSSGKCQNIDVAYTTSCVMADALRDRFPGADNLDVGSTSANFDLPDGRQVTLAADLDMANSIRAFDDIIDEVRQGRRRYGPNVMNELRNLIPRVVHATVVEVFPAEF
jgi:hypothetical protein